MNDKKPKKNPHAFDMWPPPRREEKKDEKDPHKPRNTSYVDPDEFIKQQNEPVFDIYEPEINEEIDEKDEDKKKK